jgi:hypothetical protein
MAGYSVSRIGPARSSQRAASLLLGAAIAVLGFISAPALAGPHVPFSVIGTIMTIDTGDVKPAGQSGRFIVRDRHITGAFTGSIGGPFVITYDSNVPITTQAGRIHARLIAGVYEGNMTLASSTGATPVECETPDGATCIATPGGNFVPGLLLNGRMNFLGGAKGQGSVTGWLIPTFDIEGHISGIVASQLTISGQWMQ